MACATALKPGAEQVRFAASLSEDEKSGYDELAPVRCEEVAATHDVEESCRLELRNKAHDQGADVLIVTNTERKTCWIGRGSDCVGFR
jgi:hypothetical protein